MEGFFIALIIAFSIFILTSIVVCIRRKQKAARNVGYTIREAPAPVVVTSATHTAPGGYPVTQLPPPGYAPNPVNAYSTVPYPAQTSSNVTVQMPMPMPMQQQPGMPTHGITPYPPMPQPASSMNPPSYDMAVANPGPSVIPAGYEKQAPYNPTYGQ